MIRVALATLLLGGCGGALRLGVGPTVDTQGNVGVLAQVGGGYAAGLGRRPRSTVILGAGGSGGYSQTWSSSVGGVAFMDYLFQPQLPEAGAATARAPAFRIGLRTGLLAHDSPGERLFFGGLDLALLVPLRTRDSTTSTSLSLMDTEKGRGGPVIHTAWLERLFVGAELDADLVVQELPQGSPRVGRFGLLVTLDYAMIGWYARPD